jgi:NTE family protein
MKGLVFGGGGAKGAYQFGVWQALRRLGVDGEISAVSGVSVGALNAYLFSCENIEQAEDIWSYDAVGGYFIDLDIRESGFSRRGLSDIISKVDDSKYLSSTRKTFVCTYNFDKRESIHHDVSGFGKEEIEKYLLASSAIPIIYKGVSINSAKHFDPGLDNNMPIEPLYALGIRDIILVYLNRTARGNSLAKFSGCKFTIIYPDRSLKFLLNFNKDIMNERILKGYSDCIMKLRGGKQMNRIGNSLIPQIHFEMMEKIFTSRERLIDFCRKYSQTPKSPTLGGKYFWQDIFTIDGYKVQSKVWQPKHIRILDENKFRIGAFIFKRFGDCLYDYESELIRRQLK